MGTVEIVVLAGIFVAFLGLIVYVARWSRTGDQ